MITHYVIYKNYYVHKEKSYNFDMSCNILVPGVSVLILERS